MRGDILPADKKEIMVFALEAPLKFMRNIARHGCDNGLRFTERQFKCRGPSSSDLQSCRFKDHCSSMCPG